jgi:hypothetical protein
LKSSGRSGPEKFWIGKTWELEESLTLPQEELRMTRGLSTIPGGTPQQFLLALPRIFGREDLFAQDNLSAWDIRVELVKQLFDELSNIGLMTKTMMRTGDKFAIKPIV